MRVLVVGYYFPPIGGGGVNRTLKLVRGLAARGWEPVVLTVDRAVWAQDPGLLAQVPPGVRVLRLPNPDWGRVAEFARRGAARGRVPGTQARPGRLRRWLVPDLHVGWSALAAPVAAAMAATRAVDLVYTTCPPYSATLAGLAGRMLGVPWLADFRDAWTDCPTRESLPAWRLRLERAMEGAVLRRADQVLFASEGARQRALARVPGLAARSETVLTGFDAGDFAGEPGGAAGGTRLEVIHAGSVLLHQRAGTLDRLIDALVAGAARDATLGDRIRVTFLGGEPQLAERFARAGLSRWVRVEAGVPRAALAARLRRAHLALAFASAARCGADPIPGKLFDAVGAGLPVLALSPAGALAEVVERLGLGPVAPPDDPEAILAVLASLQTRVARGERISGPPESSRRALSNERAVELTMAAMLRARAPVAAGRTGACPSPSAS